MVGDHMLIEKKRQAELETPLGMLFVGWLCDGRVYKNPLATSRAVAVYIHRRAILPEHLT